MKMFLSLTLLLTSFLAFGQGGTLTATGAVKFQKKEFISVVNSSSSTLAKGSVVCFDITDDNAIGVDLCATAGFKAAGVITASCAVGARCLAQTKGYFADILFKYVATTNSVAGGVLYATNDGKAYAATAAAGLVPLGIALDVSASADGVLEAVLDF